MPETWDFAQHTPASLWQLCSSRFAVGSQSARDPFHLLTVATTSSVGSPDQRTVVLRSFDAELREISFHTDIRSSKVAQLAAVPQVSLHWYDAVARVQVRIAATATIHHGDTRAEQAWNDSRTTSRACYTAANAPGTAVEVFPTAPPIPLDDDRQGLVHFAVVTCTFSAIEVLSLHAAGHQRVRLLLETEPVRWQLLAP